MATENPMRLMPGGGMRGGIGALSDSFRSSSGGALSSSPSREGVAQELDLLLRGHSRYENILSRREMVPHRSGSAPPSVEGSLAAIGGLFSHPGFYGESGSHLSNSGSGNEVDMIESEQELRSDPQYLAYYYSHINLNPRLPTPLISRENYQLARRLVHGGSGDKRKIMSFDDSNCRSLFSSQPVLPTHKEEPELSEEDKSPIGNLFRQVSNEWMERGADGFRGFSSRLSARPKTLVDLIQEDFPRTPSPVYQLRSSSRATNEDGADTTSGIDVPLSHLRDSSISAVPAAELGSAALSSRSATPNSGTMHILGSSSTGGFSTGPSVPVSRIPSPAPPVHTSGSSSGAVIGTSGVNAGLSIRASEGRSALVDADASVAGTTELAAALQSFSLADVQGVSSVEEHEQLQLPQQQQEQLQQEPRDPHFSSRFHHHRQQRSHITQAQTQVQQSQSLPQAFQQPQQFSSVEQSYRVQGKYGLPNVTSQSQGMGLQGGAAPNMYAAAAAAMSYMAAGNPYYQNLQSTALYAPQYGLGGYPLNATIMPAIMAGYPASGAMPLAYDNIAAAAVAAGIGARGTASGSPGGVGVGVGVDMQHLYKYTGQPGTSLQSHIPDPLYLHYLQQRTVEDARLAAAYNDSSLFRGYGPGAHIDPLEMQKNQLGSMLGYSADQKIPFPRSGSIGVPTGGKSNSVSPGYYGSPPGVGFVMPYPSSPISSPVLPGSPVIPGGLSLRQTDRNYRLPLGGGRSPVGGSYIGWQSQRGSDVTEEVKGSSLLEELKNSKTRRFELSDITGHVVEFSADQHGSRFIQQKLETASVEEKALVFQEVLPQALTLMTDVFGNYVIQKFFEHGTPEQRADLANQLVGHVLNLSLQMYGCRVIQKALEVVDVELQSRLVSELDGHVMRCVRDQNGNHVIQKCIECVPPDRIHFIISAFYSQVVMLSTHPYGCRVIQRVLEHCTDEQKQGGIMEEILLSTCNLAQDQYGNYVVQHVLEHGNPQEKSEIITKLAGQIVQMSQHKFASNVIEKCLEFGGPAERQILINEMLGHTEENEPLQMMMKDQFANYVVQKVLETCNDQQRELLLSRIRVHLHALKKYTYGKHIVARVEKLVAAGERRNGQGST